MSKHMGTFTGRTKLTSFDVSRRIPVPLLAQISWVCSVILFGVTMAIDVHGSQPPNSQVDSALSIFTLLTVFLAFSTVGMMIGVRRPENPIGWVFCAAGLTYIGVCCARIYALDALSRSPGSMPGASVSAWIAAWLTIPPVYLIATFLPLLFPTGSVPSPRWRLLAKLAIGGMTLTTLEVAFSPGHLPNPGFTSIDNPLGIHGALGSAISVTSFALVLLPTCAVLATASLFLRLRRSSGSERRQLGLFFGGTALIAATFLVALLLGVAGHSTTVALNVARVMFAAVPITAGVAILRYRLWDIDTFIDRTLVYGSLTVAIIALNVLVVGGIGTFLHLHEGLLLSIVTTGIAAVLFQPLRTQMQRVASRLIYGERDDPYAVISRLGARLEASLSVSAVLPTIADTIARALKLPGVTIWLIDGEVMRRGATHGLALQDFEVRDAEAIALLRASAATSASGLSSERFEPGGEFRELLDQSRTSLILPLAHRGEVIGALCLAARGPGEPFTPADLRLLRGLASQAGAAVEAVTLNARLKVSLEDVRRSREQLLLAQEQERRRIQRDLHDGLGPVLAGIRLRLEACLDQAQQELPSLADNLERLYEQVNQASIDIRRLVYELRPPILDEMSLVEALQRHIERIRQDSRLDVEFICDPIIDIESRMEVPLFRIAQEALVNVQNHANAHSVTVRLERLDESVILEVEDDGVGLSLNGTCDQNGAGLANMRFRAELLGGTIDIRAGKTGGTKVSVRLPTTIMMRSMVA